MTHLEARPVLRTARVLRQTLLLIFGALILCAALLVAWMILDLAGAGQLLAQLAGYGGDAPPVLQSLALGVIVLLHLGIWTATAWQGQLIFSALLDEDMNSASTAARKIARLFWVMLVWGVISGMLVSVVATWHFPEGQRVLAISLGSAQISTVLAALLATFTAHAFVLGAALWQDHKEVI